ncbi:MAG: Glyoxalase-like domain protein [Gemmatimonadetes bacterium]|nr:Glyoxalase-like domain protein [Gemmatimonadota bacterium]
MPTLSQSRIGQIAVVCRDVARATAFYRDTLGLRFLFAAGPALSFFDCGGVRLMLTGPDGAGDKQLSSLLYYFVQDIEGTKAALADKGVVFRSEPHMIAQMPDHQLWLCDFEDSEGNVLALMEEKR